MHNMTSRSFRRTLRTLEYFANFYKLCKCTGNDYERRESAFRRRFEDVN